MKLVKNILKGKIKIIKINFEKEIISKSNKINKLRIHIYYVLVLFLF